jgi:hypothetical protein
MAQSKRKRTKKRSAQRTEGAVAKRGSDFAVPRMLVILGMHRAGTSVLARGVVELGVALGDDLLPPVSGDNETGFWEDREVVEFNDELLARLARSWDSLPHLDVGLLATPALAGMEKEASSILRRKAAGHSVFGLKDPRLARLLPFWRPLFETAAARVDYLIAIRDPVAVVASLAKRNQMHPDKGYLLWLLHTVDACRGVGPSTHAQATQGSVLVVDYDRFIEHPSAELSRIASGFELPFDATSPSTCSFVESFVQRDLRHFSHADHGLVAERTGNAVAERACALHEVLCRAAEAHRFLDDPDVQAAIADAASWLQSIRPALGLVSSLERVVATVASQAGAAGVLPPGGAPPHLRLDAMLQEIGSPDLDVIAAAASGRDDFLIQSVVARLLRVERELVVARRLRDQAHRGLHEVNLQSVAAHRSLQNAQDALQRATAREQEEARRTDAEREHQRQLRGELEARMGTLQSTHESALAAVQIHCDLLERQGQELQAQLDNVRTLSEQTARALEFERDDLKGELDVARATITDHESAKAHLSALNADLDARCSALEAERVRLVAGLRAAEEAEARLRAQFLVAKRRIDEREQQRAAERSKRLRAATRARRLLSRVRQQHLAGVEGARQEAEQREEMLRRDAGLLHAEIRRLHELRHVERSGRGALQQRLDAAEQLAQARLQQFEHLRQGQQGVFERLSAVLVEKQAALGRAEHAQQRACSRLDASLAEAARLRRRTDRLEAKLSAITGSLTWRLTGPVRWLLGIPSRLIRRTRVNREVQILTRSGLFDEAWYRLSNPDIGASRMGLAEHYIRYGEGEGRRPRPDFSAADYLAKNPDVARRGGNAFVHWVTEGVFEQRDGVPRVTDS